MRRLRINKPKYRHPIVPGLPKLMIGIKLLDHLGKIIKEYREPGHSWTRNAYNWLFACMTDACGGGVATFGAGYMSAKRNTGVIYSTNTTTANRASSVCPTTTYGIANSAQNNTTGIVVGTSDAAFDIDGHTMGALIAHGTLANQLSYQIQARPVLSYDSKVWKATHSRQFLNGSAGAITVKEVGIHYGSQMFSSTTTYQWLMARDVLIIPVEVLATESLIVEYEMSMNFADID